MGVPGFFMWLMQNYKKKKFVFRKETTENKEINEIDYFLIDTNCLIHPVCFKVIADYAGQNITNDKLEEKMMDSIIEYIEKIIQYVNPKVGVYVAIDGVAPMAKIKQQRMRRFKSIADKKLWDSIRKKHSRPVYNSWNNSAITPGTKFMEKLHNRILSWKKENVIYSSCFTPAEGEHKLLQFIRNNQLNNKQYKYCIYGLDADLIFLALSTINNDNKSNIYLLRESIESKDILSYVCMNTMKECIIDTIKTYITKKLEIDDVRIVRDFIFMCYFLGNDFLPHIVSLDIHNEGIERLIQTYIKVVNELSLSKMEYLLDKTNINNYFFLKFINYLGSNEDTTLEMNYMSNKRRVCNSEDEYEKEVFRIENLQFKINDPIKLGYGNSDEWRKRYYKHYWDLEDNEIEEFSEKMVVNYLIGVKWVTKYYFEKCPSWDWYYPFDYTPFLKDISKYCNKFDFNKYQFQLGKPVKPFVQLLLVLPPQSNYLLPDNLRKLVTNNKSSLIHLYPSEFEIDFINKTKHWMGIVILPALDPELVKHSYKKYEKELKPEDLERNKLL